MNELTSNIGINSIYGALQILWLAEKENAKVNLHCHAGVNRSVTCADAYYFLRTGTHRIRKPDPRWEGYGYFGKAERNRLMYNCEGHLMGLDKMEEFIKICATTFAQEDGKRGFFLDDMLSFVEENKNAKDFRKHIEWKNYPVNNFLNI